MVSIVFSRNHWKTGISPSGNGFILEWMLSKSIWGIIGMMGNLKFLSHQCPYFNWKGEETWLFLRTSGDFIHPSYLPIRSNNRFLCLLKQDLCLLLRFYWCCFSVTITFLPRLPWYLPSYFQIPWIYVTWNSCEEVKGQTAWDVHH